MIIGGFALAALGVVRASSDVDALLYVSYSRFVTISTLFEAAEFNVTLRRGDDDNPILSMLVLSDAYGRSY
ncbi:MAG TPA: hypothetical protein VGD54_12790 [Steroidobacteraceae bacterium]